MAGVRTLLRYLNSDGINTAHDSAPFKFRSRAKIVLVNGTGSVGNLLEALDPLRFESLQSALQFIAENPSGYALVRPERGGETVSKTGVIRRLPRRMHLYIALH